MANQLRSIYCIIPQFAFVKTTSISLFSTQAPLTSYKPLQYAVFDLTSALANAVLNPKPLIASYERQACLYIEITATKTKTTFFYIIKLTNHF